MTSKEKPRAARRLLSATVLLWTACWPIGALAQAQDESALAPWLDFEQPGLSKDWVASGKVTLARKPLIAPLEEEAKPDGKEIEPSGFGLSISAAEPGGAYTRPGVVPPDLAESADCELWVYRSPDEAKARPMAAIEIQFLEGDGKTRFWRKADLSHEGWKRLELPLRWFHRGDGRIPSWASVERFGVRLRTAGEIQIDAVAFRKRPGQTAELSHDDIIETAFGSAEDGDVRVKSVDGIVMMSDAEALDLGRLAERMQKLRKALNDDFKFVEQSGEAPLLVFASEKEYREFPVRLAERLNAQAAPSRSGGFTVLGIATSFYDPAQGDGRPVFLHECVHAILTDWLQMGNKGEWLHEGLAARYQLRFHPQADIPKIVAEGLADPAKRADLATLTSGEPIPMNRYWQAATFVDMLFTDPKYSPRLAKLIGAIQKAGDTNLDPHVGPILETDWPKLTADWQSHCETSFAK
jgi:hypothetical protein